MVPYFVMCGGLTFSVFCKTTDDTNHGKVIILIMARVQRTELILVFSPKNMLREMFIECLLFTEQLSGGIIIVVPFAVTYSPRIPRS